MGALVGSLLRFKFFIDRHTLERSFRRKCQNPLKTQWAFLKELLYRNQDTAFGRKYRFAEIKNLQDFRDRVPIHLWEDLEPYMEEVQRGNLQVLFPSDEELLMFATTSGTTGKPKFIPYTRAAYEHYSAWSLMWPHLLKESPRTFYGHVLTFPGDPEEGYFGKIPYGAISAKCYAQQNWLVRYLYPYPYTVSRIKDYALRYYTIMRIAVEKQVSFIPIANPSTILTLFKVARERREDIIEDIRAGRLRDADRMPAKFRDVMLKKLRPNPWRARELEEICKKTGDFLPCDYWKGLCTFLSWSGGPLRLYLEQLSGFVDFSQVKFFDLGLLASEGRFSFPISSKQKGTCLNIVSNFFEFIPEDQADDPDADVLTADQLKQGNRYFILITNASGLYRYNIHDLIEVAGFYEQAPLIRFCNKGKHISNITGEKITEFQVTEGARRASEKVGYPIKDFTVCLHWDDHRPSYTFLKNSDPDDDERTLQTFINAFESELMEMNLEYRSKRESMRLGPVRLKVVHGYEDYEKEKKLRTHNLSQYKHAFLVNDPAFEKQFPAEQEVISSIAP
jgi:hypothetical protein